MFINTKMRLTILASAIALAAAAPAAFAQGTWHQGMHTDPATGAADFGGERHSKELMEKKIGPSNVTANAGTWSQGIHTDPSTGAADFGGERHSKEVMEKKIVPSNPAQIVERREQVGG